jgi:hypothetical protein
LESGPASPPQYEAVFCAFGVDDSRSGKFRIRGKNVFQFVNLSFLDGVRDGFCDRIVCPYIHD